MLSDAPASSHPPLVARDLELARLLRILAATAAGAGGGVDIVGTRGIGKTRLILEVIRLAEELGLARAWGQAAELELRPLTTLTATLRNCQPPGIDLTGLGADAGDRFRCADRLGRALEEYAMMRPLLVVIDDAQWMDEFSAQVLRLLIRDLSSLPVRWLLARRPWTAPRPVAQEVIERLVEDGFDHIALGPLGLDQVGEICANLLGARPDDALLEMVGRASGNPYLVGQMVEALRSADRLAVTDGVASPLGDELPSTFHATVDMRLRGLSDLTLRLLQAGSVLGRPFTVRTAARILGAPPIEALHAAEQAMAADLLTGKETELTFSHDVMREVVYSGLSGPAKATLHGEAVAALRAEGAPALEIAEHLLRSGPAGDADALAYLAEAAEEVADRAPGTAANLIIRALDLMGGDDPTRPGLVARAVNLLSLAGRLSEASRLGEAALQGRLDQTTRATILLGLAEALKHAGQNPESVEHVRRALISSLPDRLRAKLLAILAHAQLYTGDPAAADAAGAEADRLGSVSGEFSASVQGKTARSVVGRIEGRLDEALAYTRDAVAMADRVGGDALHRHPRIWLGAALTSLDRFPEAEAAFLRAQREAERLGTAWSQPLCHFQYAAMLVAKGRLDDAVAEAETGLRIADELTARQLCVPLHGLLATVCVVQGKLPLARDHVRRMNRLVDDGITAATELVAWPVAALEAATGRARAAFESLADVYDALPDRSLFISHDPASAPALVRIARQAGAPERAEAVVVAARRLAERNPSVVSLAGAAIHAEGLLTDDLAALRKAVGQLRGSPRPLLRAAVLEDAAVAEYDQAGNRADALAHTEAALEIYLACGARGAEERLDKLRRRFGVTRPDDEGELTNAVPLDGLTPTEQRVAHLVAKGKTNGNIARALKVKPSTIDTHLRHIYRKLGINSRAELGLIVGLAERSTVAHGDIDRQSR
jgi:DNA-binding CsgD family transcriptional regulator